MKYSTLLMFYLLSFAFLSLSGCIYKSGGSEIYAATSDSEKGLQFIEEYDVKYISPNVYSLYYADIYRGKGVYAMNVRTVGGRIKYSEIDPEIVNSLNLRPKATIWDRFGIFVILLLIGLFFSMPHLEKLFEKGDSKAEAKK